MLAMTAGEIFLAEFEPEMASTGRMLGRVPDEFLEFQPHPKSMTLGRLAGHVAELPSFGTMTVQSTEIDFQPVDGPAFQPFVPADGTELLATFDRHVAAAKAAIAEASDEDLQATFTLRAAGNLVFAWPRIQVLKSMVLNHIIHHRAQLGVYLRLKDVPVPGMYGPTADEPFPGS